MSITFDPRAISPRLPELSRPNLGSEIGTGTGTGAGIGSGTAIGSTEPTRGFGDRLADAVRATDAEQKRAEAATTALAEGRSDDLHGTMLSLQRADVSLRLAANVRSRAIEAYREVMRMGG